MRNEHRASSTMQLLSSTQPVRGSVPCPPSCSFQLQREYVEEVEDEEEEEDDRE